DEADQLADRVSVIDQGRVIAEGSPDQLKSKLGGDRLEVGVARADQRAAARAAQLAAAAVTAARAAGAPAEADPDTRRVGAPVRDRVAALTEAARALHGARIAVGDTPLR